MDHHLTRRGKHVVNKPLTFQYGHNGSQVLVIINQPIDNITLTPAQVTDMIKGLQAAAAGLEEHMKASRNG